MLKLDLIINLTLKLKEYRRPVDKKLPLQFKTELKISIR